MNHGHPGLDPRQRRTRESLHSAFVQLATERRYHEIRIHDILQVAGISRSAFYEHFPSKDALLASCMEDATLLLAGMPSGKSTARQVQPLLDHFWEKRALARGIFQGTSLRVIRNALVRQIEAGLEQHQGRPLRLPHRLAAYALADGIFSPIMAWLAGESACTSAVLAVALQDASQAMLSSLAAPARRNP